MENSIIKRISISCSCNEHDAQRYLDGETRNLQELKELNDLRYSDMEQACSNLGLEYEFVSYFIGILSIL